MPRGDRTGPEGRGSMTGRGLGRCSDNGNRNFGSDFGGWGRGRGFFNGFRGSGGGRGFGRGNGYGFGYHANSWNTGYEGDMQADTLQSTHVENTGLTQQLNTVIEQLSKLLKQSPKTSEMNDEKK